MGIKEKLLGKRENINPAKEEEELPEDFEISKEGKEKIDEADDIDITEFIAKKKALQAEKDAKNSPKQEKEEEPKPIEETVQPPQMEEQPEQPLQKKESSLSSILTIYLEKDRIEETKQKLQAAIDGGYMVGMQTGIQVTKENVEKVKAVLKYFSDNGYLVVISGEQVEPVFDDSRK